MPIFYLINAEQFFVATFVQPDEVMIVRYVQPLTKEQRQLLENTMKDGSVTDSCAITPWRKGAYASRAIARKALAETHRTNHIDIQ